MKSARKKLCGTPLQKGDPAPAQEVLEEQGEIFSCGGIYLGLNRSTLPLPDKFEFLSLPKHRQPVLVLNNQKTYRLPGKSTQAGALSHQDRASTEETLRRFFKESLN